MSRMELAEKAGITERTVRNLESGVYKPSMPTAIKLAEALGVTLDSFVTGGSPSTSQS